MVATSIQVFDRMIINREASRRLLRKENERRLSDAGGIPAPSDSSKKVDSQKPVSMATEKQIAANRANAKKSTGPRTLAGKLKSSRNAYRHGLSSPSRLDFVMSAQTEVIVRALIGGDENEEKLRAATEFAAAHLELLRIRSMRADLMAKVDLAQPDIQELQRLAALDRYERYAHTKRRRTAFKL